MRAKDNRANGRERSSPGVDTHCGKGESPYFISEGGSGKKVTISVHWISLRHVNTGG